MVHGLSVPSLKRSKKSQENFEAHQAFCQVQAELSSRKLAIEGGLAPPGWSTVVKDLTGWQETLLVMIKSGKDYAALTF